MAEAAKKRLVILGGGYGGMTLARFLEKRADEIGWEILLINRDNFFLFTPMLGEVATGSIETRHIINPIRQLCRRIRFEEREVLAIDPKRKAVKVRQEATGREEGAAYDKLVIALGSATNFFSIPGLKENAITMKSLGDAIYVRNHIISLFEQADTEKYPQVQAPLVTFVVVGGGFAGVELAGELNDFAHYLRKYYPYVNSSLIRVILLEGASRLLLEVGEELAAFALETLKEKGMEVRLSARVKEARADRVILASGEEILTRTLVWTAGVIPQPLVSALPFQKDKRGRLVVNEFLQSVDDPDIWVVGDCCSLIDPRSGQPYPPTAQHALRQGKRAAQNILAELTGGKKKPFQYNMLGQMAMLGRRSGVAIILGFRVKGFWAWWTWRTYYLFRLPRLAKKLRVMLDWTIDLFFERDIAQLKPYHHRPGA
ncbi:MAG: NAD(P)/FAD-dependent oxidoreductase [candidate division Zixibacteria bacterium]|nr:NAD(P)/FAD-dependent oxidoreductase [candidate division Zixibacteria bacterium]MCI0596182.1 NAD(P)/FAD-dependent oxidoreductase [candidate division Zixibacteria bacterium]